MLRSKEHLVTLPRGFLNSVTLKPGVLIRTGDVPRSPGVGQWRLPPPREHTEG